MNTLNYIGCKQSLLNIIKYIIDINVKDDKKQMSFMELFAGTGVVAFNFLNNFKTIYSNDLEYYSFIINKALITCSFSQKLKDIINTCNNLSFNNIDLDSCLIYKNFCPDTNCKRMFFTPENGKKADVIRQYIQKIYNEKTITTEEYYFLIASLLISLDKVANTTSVYGAYLKKIKTSANKTLLLRPVHTSQFNPNNNNVYNELAEELVNKVYSDFIYLDPPYNSRQYSANYSPLNYIAQYDEKVNIKGKTGLIENYNRSSFCVKKTVLDVFKSLINDCKCKYLLLSYNDEGILSFDDIKNILLIKGDLTLYKVKYKKYKSVKKDTKKEFVYEYLWFVKVCETNDIRFYDEVELVK